MTLQTVPGGSQISGVGTLGFSPPASVHMGTAKLCHAHVPATCWALPWPSVALGSPAPQLLMRPPSRVPQGWGQSSGRQRHHHHLP